MLKGNTILKENHDKEKFMSPMRFLKKKKWQDPHLGIWECKKCGYRGSVVVEDDSVQKKVREAKEM